MPGAIDIVIPVLNEERTLAESVSTLRAYLSDAIPNPWRIVIADNGSDDGTPEVARLLTEEYPEVASLRMEQRGRGRALRRAWLESDADAMCYMDVDLSTDLAALLPLAAVGDNLKPATAEAFTKVGFKDHRGFRRRHFKGGHGFRDRRFGGHGFAKRRFFGHGFRDRRFGGHGFGKRRFFGQGFGSRRFGGQGFGQHGFKRYH